MDFVLGPESHDDGLRLVKVLGLPGLLAYRADRKEGRARVGIPSLEVMGRRTEHGEAVL